MAIIKGRTTTLSKVQAIDIDWARIPPIPAYIVLTDRDDGTLWLLTFNVVEASPDGLGYISITTDLPLRPKGNIRIYSAYEGPIIGDTRTLRLLVRGGYLGYEQITANLSGNTVMARHSLERLIREIIKPATFVQSPDEIAWRDRQL